MSVSIDSGDFFRKRKEIKPEVHNLSLRRGDNIGEGAVFGLRRAIDSAGCGLDTSEISI